MAIQLPFSHLSQWQQIAFSAALLERMIPNYKMFAEHAEFGEFSVLRNQLALIWQWLDKNNRCKINYDAQINKLEPQIPDPQAFDFFGVFPAIDATMATMSLLQAMQDKEVQGAEIVSRLSENSVNYYVELIIADQQEQNDDSEITDKEIENHPLMEWEFDTQNELYYALKDSPETKETCVKIKAMVLEEGLSNLGIEIT
ncbi:MAG: YjaG family protein [Colwellia sp.]|nr:YjaG family protein [Colwellia sp.]